MSEGKSINKVDVFGNAINVAFNLVWPIGVTYPQYPGEKSPMDLWGKFSTWEPINYNGAFFRAAGGNANPWIEVTTTNGRNFTIKEGRTVPLNSALKYGATVMFNGESRTVNNVVGSGASITSFDVTSAFTEPGGGYKNITNVYILQGDGNKKHSHTFTLSTDTDVKTGQFEYQGAYVGSASGVFSVNSIGTGLYAGSIRGLSTVDFHMEHSHSVTGTINESGIEETRPSNIAYTIWRRTA